MIAARSNIFSTPKKSQGKISVGGPRPEPSIPIATSPPGRPRGGVRGRAVSRGLELEHARGCGIKCGYRCSSVKLFNDINCGLRMRSATWPFSSRRSVFGQSTHARARQQGDQGLVLPWRRKAFRRSTQWIGRDCARPQPIIATVSQHPGRKRLAWRLCKGSHCTQQCCNLPTALHSLRRVAAVL